MDMAKSRQEMTVFIAHELHARVAEWFTVKGRIYFVEAMASKWVDLIPTYILKHLAAVSDGIDQDDLEAWKLDLITYGNKAIDIPFVPEVLEQQVIEPIVDMILEAAQQGFAIIEGKFFADNAPVEAVEVVASVEVDTVETPETDQPAATETTEGTQQA